MTVNVAHLIDDQAIGGVSRGLMDRLSKLPNGFDCKQVPVEPARLVLPPARRDIAVIHYTVSWAKLPFLIMLRSQYGGRPIVIVEHSYTRAFEELHVKNIRRFRKMLKLNYALADVVVAVSFGQAEWLLGSDLVPEAKLRVIRSATDCKPLFDLPLAQRSNGPLRLAAYGRFNEQKAFDTLIEAMRLVPPHVAKLTLAGYGELEMPLKRQAAGLPNVEFEGKIEGTLPEFLSRFDAVAVPSRFEAFGIVATEARSAARPIIVTQVDGLLEQVHANYGLSVPPDNPALLAIAIGRLADMDVSQMGGAARESAIGHFETNISGWSTLLADLQRD